MEADGRLMDTVGGVISTTTVAVTVALIAGLLRECTATVTVPCPPAVSATWLVARLLTSAAGPANAKLKVSATWPMLVTVIWNMLPGATDGGFRATLTPCDTTARVPGADAVTDVFVVEAAVTWKA